MLLSGVRSSCDMFARNSDLYFDVSASSAAFSSTARRELEERAEQLALSSRYKSEFLANMSHELRTPLNSLMILAKLLAENQTGNLDNKQVEFAQSMFEAGNDLLKLISDILDLSKVEAGKMDVSIAPVDLVTLASDIEQMFRPIAEQQSLDFAVEVAPDTPDPVVTDERRVQQVLKNLLSNAFKFTEDGSVRLRVGPPPAGTRFTRSRLRAAPAVIAFSVVDTGIGIASDQLLVIFEAFQQADGTTNRRYGGTGLGLSISREIARLLDGELQVESEPGKGSVFTLLLPAVAEPQSARTSMTEIGMTEGGEEDTPEALRVQTLLAAETDTAAAVPGATPGVSAVVSADAARSASLGPSHAETMLAGKFVLIVDDDVRNVYALTSVLENRGMEVLVAEDGRTGIELLRGRPGVDVVLMDIMMPVMDGYETTRAIRQLDGFRDLPIIALTAKAMRGDREKCLAAGASDYITKPVDVDQLLDMLRVWLYR